MEGEKKAPLTIGKSARPKCFKNLKSLPLAYTHQKKAWMDEEIFSK